MEYPTFRVYPIPPDLAVQSVHGVHHNFFSPHGSPVHALCDLHVTLGNGQ
jgi:hypothetical protein